MSELLEQANKMGELLESLEECKKIVHELQDILADSYTEAKLDSREED